MAITSIKESKQIATGLVEFTSQFPGLFLEWYDASRLSRCLKDYLYHILPDDPNIGFIHKVIDTIDEVIW